MAPSTAPAATPPSAPDPITPAFDTLGLALSGDPVVLRGLAATLGTFSIRLLVALLILGATLWIAARLARLVETGLNKAAHARHSTDNTLSTFVATLVRYLVIAVGLVAVLQQLGVQATSVLAVLGAASLAIGLALQGTLGNVAAGVMILLLRPYRAGDRVELGGRQGRVQGLDLFNTKLLGYDGLTVYLPNGKVFGDTIVNISQGGRRRVDVVFGVDYEDDLDLALEILLEAARGDARVQPTPEPWAKVTASLDSAMEVTLRCWTSTDDWQDVRFDLIKQIKETFDARGVSIPYPHQVEMSREAARPKPASAKPARKPAKA